MIKVCHYYCVVAIVSWVCNKGMKSFHDLSTKEKSDEKKEFAVRLGKHVRKVRISKGLTQEELADRAGYYRTYVGHIENAKYSPSVHTVWRLASAMKMSVNDLLDGLK